MNGKFKVWDSVNKVFAGDELLREFFINSDGVLCYDLICVAPAHPDYSAIYPTGQTDKNGTEIYQGEIRQCSVGKYVIEVGPFIYTDPDGVEHHFSGIHKKWISKFEDNVSPFDTEHDKNDLYLGHKLENPELLEVKK